MMGLDSKSKSWFEIQNVPGKDLGIVAIRDIPRGTRILAENPLVNIDMPEQEGREGFYEVD